MRKKAPQVESIVWLMVIPLGVVMFAFGVLTQKGGPRWYPDMLDAVGKGNCAALVARLDVVHSQDANHYKVYGLRAVCAARKVEPAEAIRLLEDGYNQKWQLSGGRRARSVYQLSEHQGMSCNSLVEETALTEELKRELRELVCA